MSHVPKPISVSAMTIGLSARMCLPAMSRICQASDDGQYLLVVNAVPDRHEPPNWLPVNAPTFGL